MANHADFLGKGWSFPLATEAGRVLMASAGADIGQAILIILQTAPGERVMLPGFGCRINELMFAAGNGTTASLAQLYVKQALDRWEPRIIVTEVAAAIESSAPNCLNISVSYVVRSSNQPGNLVYPFFLKS